MARRGQTRVTFNQKYFDQIMQKAGVDDLAKEAAEKALRIAQATAPVDTGDYRDGLKIERHEAAYRYAWRVVGTDPKTMIIEAKRGTLARALKQATR